MKKTMFITSVVMVVVLAIALTTSSLAWFNAGGSNTVGTNALIIKAARAETVGAGLQISNFDNRDFASHAIDLTALPNLSTLSAVAPCAGFSETQGVKDVATANIYNALTAASGLTGMWKNKITEDDYNNSIFAGTGSSTIERATAGTEYYVDTIYLRNNGATHTRARCDVTVEVSTHSTSRDAKLWVAVFAVNAQVENSSDGSFYVDGNGDEDATYDPTLAASKGVQLLALVCSDSGANMTFLPPDDEDGNNHAGDGKPDGMIGGTNPALITGVNGMPAGAFSLEDVWVPKGADSLVEGYERDSLGQKIQATVDDVPNWNEPANRGIQMSNDPVSPYYENYALTKDDDGKLWKDTGKTDPFYKTSTYNQFVEGAPVEIKVFVWYDGDSLTELTRDTQLSVQIDFVATNPTKDSDKDRVGA